MFYHLILDKIIIFEYNSIYHFYHNTVHYYQIIINYSKVINKLFYLKIKRNPIKVIMTHWLIVIKIFISIAFIYIKHIFWENF